MRNLIWFLALIILLIIQAGILLPFYISHINLILIVVALAALLSGFNQGLVITLIGGLLLDFLSGSPDGLLSMSLVTAFLITHLILSEILARDPNRFILAASVGAATIVYFAAVIIFSKIFAVLNLSGSPDISYLLKVQLPLATLWNLIFTYPIFLFYTLIQNLVSKLPNNEKPIST